MSEQAKKLSVKDILKPALSLFLFCLVVTALLAGTNLLTKDKIAEQERLAEETSRMTVSPGAETFSAADDGTYYIAEAGGEAIGYVFTTTASSYGGQIKVMTGISTDGIVFGRGQGLHSQRSLAEPVHRKPHGGKPHPKAVADKDIVLNQKNTHASPRFPAPPFPGSAGGKTTS